MREAAARSFACCSTMRPQQPPAPPARRTASPLADAAGARPARFTGHTRHARLPGRRSALGAAHLRRHQRPEHRDRPDDQRHGRCLAASDVPWDQALDIILKANKLGLRGRWHRRAHRAARCAGARRRGASQAADAQALAGELARADACRLSYAKAPELVPILTRSALSARGEVQVDTRTNTLIVRDLPDRLTTAAELDQDARPAAAAGRDRSAHRADDARLCARDRRRVGLQRPRRSGARQHDEPRVPEQRQPQRPHSGSVQGPTRAARRPKPASTCARRRPPAPSASRSAR